MAEAKIEKQDADTSTKKINEKEHTQSSAPLELSNILHSTFGIDHYPNYLYRWNLNNITQLETQLLSQLKHIQSRKQQLQQIVNLSKSFNGILNNTNQSSNEQIQLINSILHTKLLPFIKYNTTNNKISLQWDWNMISEIMAEEIEYVYSFPLFDTKFCDKLLQHTDQYIKFIANINKINQNNDCQLLLSSKRSVLDWMNLGWLNDFLLEQIINPITKHLFQNEMYYNCTSSVNNNNKNEFEIKHRLLDWRHGYIIGYKAKHELYDDIYDENKEEKIETNVSDKKGVENIYQRSGLVNHTDDSEITLNCCLNDEFEGGILNIYNIRGKEYIGKGNEHLRYESELETEIKLKKGYGIIHRGRQLHSVSDVNSGQRAVLIVWCRSVNGVRNEVCPCCWLNRRNDFNCICGQLWN
eukprot:123225_1